MSSSSHLDTLNPAQRSAAEHTTGPLLIVAGAGAGKTKTLTHRILNIIKTGVAPDHILAITFTNKAAREMADRVRALLQTEASVRHGSRAGEPFVATFHSLGAYILRTEHEATGRGTHFSILDDDDTNRLLKQAIIAQQLDPKQFEPRRLKNAISREKGELMTADRYAANVGNEYFPRIVAGVWKEYERLLAQEKAFDFDDLILRTTLLLIERPDIRAKYQDKWTHIHIDEYQDTNVAQYKLSKILAGERGNICVVGDTDQSIYGWRGADFRNMMTFEEDYPNATVVLLEENYRSTEHILKAANDIIKKNKVRKDKTLFTRKEGGEKISIVATLDEKEEARFIAEKCRELMRQGVSPKQIAVLYRANFQSRALEEGLLSRDIPYQVLGVKFFNRMEVKHVLAYIRAALNPDATADLARILNVPARGLGKTTLAKVLAGDELSLPQATKEKVAGFRAILSDIAGAAESQMPSMLIRFVIKRSGLEDMFKNDREEGEERLENAYELVALATKYDELPLGEGVATLLSDAALASDQDSLGTHTKKDVDAVRLMTVHASKGLEFPYVFITGMEQDLFPHRGFDGPVRNPEREEEERRLFYVAITRAEKKVWLTYAHMRTVFGSKNVNTPSDFLMDLDESYTETEDAGEPVIEYL
ncbi:MAG: UvrD-helicase domain-containing protein [Candidatus Yonathbacteria bacterium]|nr:UvrD-helicase domain-containing protein [Candidatus Yonathbacteria bacterium]